MDILKRKKGEVVSEEWKKIIIDEYKSGMGNTYVLGKKYNIEPHTIMQWLRKEGIHNSGYYKRKDFPNEDYFSIIDTEKKAYFLGLLFADGYREKKRNLVGISLKENDGYILDILAKELNISPPKTIYPPSWKNKGYSPQKRIIFHSKKLSEDLEKHGMLFNKSYTLEEPVEVPNEFMNHFIRGYFDGDGCCYVLQNEQRDIHRISFVSTEHFCLWLGSYLHNNVKITNKLPRKINGTVAFDLHYEKRSDIDTLRKYIYKDATVFLGRKKDKVFYPYKDEI